VSNQPNLREWTRINQILDVVFRLGDGMIVNGTTRNISANGVLINASDQLKAGDAGELIMTRIVGAASIEIRGRGEVVRVDDKGIAVHLSLLIGEESYDHIRNLIVYNAADEAAKADQEFQDHIGLERPKD